MFTMINPLNKAQNESKSGMCIAKPWRPLHTSAPHQRSRRHTCRAGATFTATSTHAWPCRPRGTTARDSRRFRPATACRVSCSAFPWPASRLCIAFIHACQHASEKSSNQHCITRISAMPCMTTAAGHRAAATTRRDVLPRRRHAALLRVWRAL